MATPDLVNVATINGILGAGAVTTSNQDIIDVPADKLYKVNVLYVSNVVGTNDATVNLSISGSANFDHRSYILKTVDVPADSTVVIEKPINLGAGDLLETQASANDDIDVFASILEMT